ncbi:hypothetical protein LWH94_09465 [Marinobacter sp. G11]|uniref:conjugative transfer protein MobI(A/C) n=1 Tax=Marinobacter sp. G11 TaxID=2903522 RepID=UPI001E2CC1BC|nr:conjugative transfer protein MobI(A/C) [Marinobacter sp. G11]MCE0759432.1 hypothetical protein [Marinobacter sp. G11]
MLGTQDELEELLEVSEEMGAQRFYIAADDLNQESRMFVQSLREQIQREIRIIALQGQKIADAYWDGVKAVRESEGSDKAKTYLGTRVFLQKDSVSFQWFRQRPNPNPKKEGKRSKAKVFSRYLKKGSQMRYSRHHFVRDPDWLKELVEEAENGYELLRRRAAALTQMKYRLREYERLLNQTYGEPEVESAAGAEDETDGE